ncbi:MAG: PAS domain S-box protein [Deltaproteobacteria bacterium]|nr:PAS domain S-box protein [Deltaproteobacteria bacterium]
MRAPPVEPPRQQGHDPMSPSMIWAHEHLAAELRPLAVAIRMSADGVLVIDLNGTIRDVNDAAVVFLNRQSPDELIGKSVVDFLLPEDRSEVLVNVQKRLAGEQIGNLEFELGLATGERRWGELQTTVMNDVHGQPVGGVVVLRDITRRRRTEEALRQSQERFALILRSTNDGLWDHDITTHEIFLSPTYKKKLGYADHELANTLENFESRLHPDDHDYVLEAVREHLRDRTSFRVEFRLRIRSGEYHWFESYGQGLWNDAGQPIRMAGSLRDITARKEASAYLEQQVKERTAELARTNATLAAHVHELETVNQELEAVTDTIAHDLRAPIRYVHGFVRLLKKRLPHIDAKSTHYLTVIADAVKQMGVQIDALLTFVWTGRKDMQRTQVMLGQIVREVVKKSADAAQGRDITWDIGSLPDVQGDPAMLRIVLTHLIDNAVKYTQPRVSARITLGCSLSTEHEVVWFVRDNGVGFDMQYAHKIFAVFHRLHRPEEFAGAGIGLALVRRIIQRHGGRIWVEAAVDHGATFYVALPRLAPGG